MKSRHPPATRDKKEVVVVVEEEDASKWQQSLPWGAGHKKHTNVKDILLEGRHSKH